MSERGIMNIIFCGSKTKGDFINEIVKRKKDKIKYTDVKNEISEYDKDILSSAWDVIIIDISELTDDSYIIVEYLKRLEKAKTAKVIIYAAGYNCESAIICDLKSAGFNKIIIAEGRASQRDEFERFVYELKTDDIIEQEEPEDDKSLPETDKKPKVIGICGVCERIGTTTQCLQLVKYIMSKGYNAAYVEINSSGYIDKCRQLYSEVRTYEDKGYITCFNVDMYKAERINDVLEKYEYIICDYGNITSSSFNKISFIERDFKICVSGTKANEFDRLQPVLNSVSYQDIFFIFNFVPENDRKDILEMMCNRADKTIFTEYTPDPFDYIQNNKYKNIIEIPEKNMSKKKGFFHFCQPLIKGGRK